MPREVLKCRRIRYLEQYQRWPNLVITIMSSGSDVHGEAIRQHWTDKTLKNDPEMTDVARMQALFDRYTTWLPSRSDVASCHTRGSIMVIGTTGFLGPHIIASLLNRSAHSDILCLNRGGDGEHRTLTALQAIMGGASTVISRLRFISVDVTQPNFGLSSAQAITLASQVEHLVFSAWDPHWTRSLQHFEPLLEAIVHAINFCTTGTRCTCITFISSVCAVGNWPLVNPDRPSIPEEVVSDHRCAMPHGYGESKHVAERLLAEANKRLNVPLNIVRVGQIGGPFSPVAGAWPRQGWLFSIMMASSRLGYFPAGVQPLDWIPVDTLAGSIAMCATEPLDGTNVRVFNIVHPRPHAWRLLYETLRGQFGLNAQLVSLSEWLGHVPAGKLKLLGFLKALRGGREHNMSYENARARRLLGNVPPITADMLCRWLESWNLQENIARARL